MMQVPRGFSGLDAPPASIYDRCVRCGLCLPACPTYLETLTETSGPRGRISLIKSVGEGNLDVLSPGFTHQMSECLDCRACEAVCPSGVHYGRLVENARAQIEQARAPANAPRRNFARWIAVHGLFAQMGRMRVAAALLRFYQRSGLRAQVRRSGILRPFGLEEAESLAPAISDRFFTPSGQRFAATAAQRATVMLHAGCIMHVAFAHVNEATVRVLQRAGCTIVVPAAQGCCGAIAMHAGDPNFARELAKRNIAAFESSGAQWYVVNAAGCGSTLKEYGELFEADDAWRERAEHFAARVRDVTEFLDDIGIDQRLGRLDAAVTYQEPCHLVHAQRISAAPRRLLTRIPGLRLVEMPESAVCCGSAGIYNLTEPNMARRLQQRKVQNVLLTGAELVATANPGCAMQVENGLRRAGSTTGVKHVVEILDDAYTAYNVAAMRPSSLSAASSEP